MAASIHPPRRNEALRKDENSHGTSGVREGDLPDAYSLMEENAQLRELVIHLSKLVIKGVVERK